MNEAAILVDEENGEGKRSSHYSHPKWDRGTVCRVGLRASLADARKTQEENPRKSEERGEMKT